MQALQVLEIIAVTNWYTDLDPFVGLKGHALECELVMSFLPPHYISNMPSDAHLWWAQC